MNFTTSHQPTFRALADPSRRAVLYHLSQGDMTIAELTAKFDFTRAAMKKHLTILEEGQLISVHRQGRHAINRLEPKALQHVQEWLSYFDQFWDEKLETLKHTIEINE